MKVSDGVHDLHFSNYSSGWIIERTEVNVTPCESWILLPAENLWNEGLRGFLYILAMIYLFLGIAISSDIFMGSIEMITSKKRTVIKWDEEKKEKVEKQVLVWNETVANLTLMALGSSAPEILLAVGEALQKLTPNPPPPVDSLGVFTIIGSAAFNLFIITSICVASVPFPQVKKVREFGVFIITSIWSIWAYVWMLIVVKFITPGVIDVWEALVTLAFFPIMVLMAYAQDNGWWCCRKTSISEQDGSTPNVHVRIITSHGDGHQKLVHGPARELQVLEHEKIIRQSNANLRSVNDSKSTLAERSPRPMSSKPEHQVRGQMAKARFRHAAVRAMLGGKKHHKHHDDMGKSHANLKSQANLRKSNANLEMADVVNQVQAINNLDNSMPEDLVGKFTFAASSYSVLESAGILEIDVIFTRRMPSKRLQHKLAQQHQLTRALKSVSDSDMHGYENGGVTEVQSINTPDTETTLIGPPDDGEEDIIKSVVTVEYETREGMGKAGKDYKHTTGTLTFLETEYRKTITIPIINDNQFEMDVDFYVILKNPSKDAGIGDPSITRVTIIDDDQPGSFTFEKAHCHADLKVGKVLATVLRQHGCDGEVTVEYATVDITAKGGKEIGPGVDYVSENSTLTFKHGETSKQIAISVSDKAKSSSNFIITLRNPSLGSKIGEHSTTVCNIHQGDALNERLAELIDEDDDEEDMDWGAQFRAAFVVAGDEDEEGNEVSPNWVDYTLHFLTFFWKVLLAFIPPKKYLGAWPTFIISILFIGVQTLIVEQLGNLLGCVISLRAAVTGITIVAFGTSVPDTFASRTAALQDEGADAAIGNVTGSNSVNVFLGLGLPWTISSIYFAAYNKPYYVRSGNLTQAVLVFSILAVMCIGLLAFRRKFAKGELGGTGKCLKWGSSIAMGLFWLFYVIFESLVTYEVFEFSI